MADKDKVGRLVGGLDDEPSVDGLEDTDAELEEAVSAVRDAFKDGDLKEAASALRAFVALCS